MYTKETSFSRRMKQAEQHAASLLQQILIFVLIFLVIFMMVQIQNLHGTAHVVNYAGLVRGATQREVKLEITGTADDMQIDYLDKILSGLKYEDGNYNLVSLKDLYNQPLLYISHLIPQFPNIPPYQTTITIHFHTPPPPPTTITHLSQKIHIPSSYPYTIILPIPPSPSITPYTFHTPLNKPSHNQNPTNKPQKSLPSLTIPPTFYLSPPQNTPPYHH